MSKIYCCSDIHGCIEEFEYALSIILEHLDEPDTKLILMGDYIHGGSDSYAVLDRIIELQRNYGEKVIALLGNHEKWVIDGYKGIEDKKYSDKDDVYISWFETLPHYYIEGNTIFVHAGIEEETGENWEWETGEYVFTDKFPAETGYFSTGQKIVAGHIYTSIIADNKRFDQIYYDGLSHYYIDGDVLTNGNILILMVNTDTDTYYSVTENGCYEVVPYGEEYR